MTGVEENYRCSVCGLPTTDVRVYQPDMCCLWDDRALCFYLQEKIMWWSEIRLLCDPSDEADRLCPDISHPNLYADKPPLSPGFACERPDIQNYEAVWAESSIFQVLKRNAMYSVDIVRYGTNDHAYIPVHTACLDIAKRVFSSPEAYVRDMRGLWTALRWRLGVTNSEKGNLDRSANYTGAGNNFYAPWWSWWFDTMKVDLEPPRRVRWPGPSDLISHVNYVHTFGSDPLIIEDLTESILSNLKEIRRDMPVSQEVRVFQGRLNSLPTELLDAIYVAMASPRDLPRITTCILPQQFWKDLLRSGTALPWLWDVDPALIDAKAAEPCPKGDSFEWNWELLVRQLSRGVDFGDRQDVPSGSYELHPLWHDETDAAMECLFACTGYADDLRDVPAGLHNRRRIWQLLEEMFVGDRLGFTGHGPSERRLVMPWTKSGGILPEATPVTMLDFDVLRRQVGGRVH